MVELPQKFSERMREYLGDSFAPFLNSYNTAPEKAVRVNTLKISVNDFLNISPFALEPVEWEPSGFYASAESLGKTVEHAAGLYYVQEPSAMSAVPKLGIRKGDRVLDLCSAPGGKGTQIAQYLQGSGVVVMNEVNRKRFDILRGNAERLGVKNCIVSNLSPERLEKHFSGYFDKILVDAPCSGEGMFKKEALAIPEWSEENVKMCALRQEKILESADRMLCRGGTLVYSTCTFSREEDEGQIEAFLKNHSDYDLLEMRKLYPHEVRGEGHFYAVLKKNGERQQIEKLNFTADKKGKIKCGEVLAAYRKWEEQTLKINLENLTVRNSSVFMLTDTIFNELPHLCGAADFDTGVYLGSLSDDGKRFVPSHRLAMCLSAAETNCIELDYISALNYLHGLTFSCDGTMEGWRLVTYKGYPLGWCKVTHGTAKNHLPKGVRI